MYLRFVLLGENYIFLLYEVNIVLKIEFILVVGLIKFCFWFKEYL